MQGLTRSLKALANERRLHIITVLMKRPSSSVHEIARAIRLSVRSTSKHLQVLAHADLVSTREVGVFVLYGINPTSVLERMLPLLHNETHSYE